MKKSFLLVFLAIFFESLILLSLVSGAQYLLEVGDSVEENGKTITLENVASSGLTVMVDIDGTLYTITKKEIHYGITINVISTFYSDVLSERAVKLYIKALSGDEYLLRIDGFTVIDEKVVTLKNVGSSGAVIVEIDGTAYTITGTETHEGLKITVLDYYYSDTLSERYAVLKIVASTVLPSHLFVVDDGSPPEDVVIMTDIISRMKGRIGDDYKSLLNSEVTKDVLDDRVTTFIYKKQGLVIIGVNCPPHMVVTGVDITTALKEEFGIPAIAKTSSEIKYDDLRKEIENKTCTDSDGGIDYYTKGEVVVCTYTETGGGCGGLVDSCSGDVLTEGYCEGTDSKTVKYTCPYGCGDGACLRVTTIPPTTIPPTCGNGICEAGEVSRQPYGQITTCPQDCGYEVDPYMADVHHCIDSRGRYYLTTGLKSASWFVWNGCAHNKYYYVNKRERLRLHVATDKAVCIHPNFYVYEYQDGNWVQKEYFDLPDKMSLRQDTYYTPNSDRIKIYAPSCFYLDVFSPRPVPKKLTIKITYPKDGQTVSGTTTISASASGPNRLDEMSLSISWSDNKGGGGEAFPLTDCASSKGCVATGEGEECTYSMTCRYKWDTTSYDDEVTLSASIKDVLGNVDTDSIKVYVVNYLSCNEYCKGQGYRYGTCRTTCEEDEEDRGTDGCPQECPVCPAGQVCPPCPVSRCCCTKKLPCPYECCEDDPNYLDKHCPVVVCSPCEPGKECPPCIQPKCINHECVWEPSEKYILRFKAGWNMFSFPVDILSVTRTVTEEAKITAKEVITGQAIEVTPVPPERVCEPISKVWHYNRGEYVELDRPVVGYGYWVKMRYDCSVRIRGKKTTIQDFPELNPGWNQIGAPSDTVNFYKVVGDCNLVSGPWWYNPASKKYEKASVLRPGEGYWVKVKDSCKLGTEIPPLPPEELGIVGIAKKIE